MNILNELLILLESKEKSLLRCTIGGKKITIKTKDEHWSGDFLCSRKTLTSLEGAPTLVGGDFNCSRNQLSSLAGAPSSVGGGFACYDNNLTSLEGVPTLVGGSFNCAYNKLTSLKGAPSSVGGNFYCNDNKLTSLAGAPSSVGGGFACSSNNLTSLAHAPSFIGSSVFCSSSKLTSLEGIHKIIKQMNGTFFVDNNPIKSHVLGLLLIKGCKKVELGNKKVEAILNKYLPNTRGNKSLLECQSELLDADLGDFAEL